MEKCSLCGGKIVNHRCVDCGMPYPEKPHYTLRSEIAHTHNVNGEEVLHRVRSAAGKDPVYTCDAEDEQDRIDLEGARPHLHAPARPAYQAKPQRRQPQRDRRRGGWLVTLIIFGLALLPLVFNLAEGVLYRLRDQGGNSYYAEADSQVEAELTPEAPAVDMTGVNPYEGMDWGLPTAGGGFGCILEPGYYTIGQQIPEGVYTITPDDGSSLTMTHDDEAHDRWYQTTMLSCPEGGEPELVLTNVQLAAGGTLWVEGSGTLTLESGNAQLDTQAEPQGNPAGESFELCAWGDDIQAYTVGQEIPAGVYDVNWNQGSGFLGWDTQSSYHLTYYGGDGFDGTVVFHSLPLTEGDTLTLECYSNEDCILWLTPVAEIYG